MSDDKTLLPELLPLPAPPQALSPRERVAERARQMLERFRGLGATAGAAVLSLHCSGYEVVDPLPPPPAACSTSPNPFERWTASAFTTEEPRSLPLVRLEIASGYYPSYNGYSLGGVRVEGGTVSSIDAREEIMRLGGHFIILIAPASPATRLLLVEVDLACGPATGTKRYQIAYEPTPSKLLTLTHLRATPDAGAADGGARD